MNLNVDIRPLQQFGENRSITTVEGAPMQVLLGMRESESAPGRVKVLFCTPVVPGDAEKGLAAIGAPFRLEMN